VRQEHALLYVTHITVRPRGGGATGFAVAAVVEAMPESGDGNGVSFGVGRLMPKEGIYFSEADGTCGLVDEDGGRAAETYNFGRRADEIAGLPPSHLGFYNEDGEPEHGWDPDDGVIVEGSRLALHLSARGAERTRTARFFVDRSEVAAFVDIEDDGGDSDWVAGVTLSSSGRACVRLVPAEGEELTPANPANYEE
jgi:hypothetical protein